AADLNGPSEILGRERLDRGEGGRPARLPPRKHVGARRPRRQLEFRIAAAIRLLAVSREEIGEARSQVAGDVLDDDRDAVGVRIDERVKVGVGYLRERALAERLVVAEDARRVS